MNTFMIATRVGYMFTGWFSAALKNGTVTRADMMQIAERMVETASETAGIKVGIINSPDEGDTNG